LGNEEVSDKASVSSFGRKTGFINYGILFYCFMPLYKIKKATLIRMQLEKQGG
jgi:hypothetical protein